MVKISVIVPCYNQAQYLDECLQSVYDQTYQDWECIIVNDGSPDDTEKVAKKWLEKDIRFKYFFKENGGLSSARNYGIERAKGEWVQFLDCDDLLEINKLQNQSFFFKKKIDVLISGYRYFEDEEGREKKRIFGRDYFLPEVYVESSDMDLLELFRIKNPFVISAPLYYATVFKKIGIFNEKLLAFEDWDFNLRCALNNLQFYHTGNNEESKTLIRLHEKSLMRDKQNLKFQYQLFKEICNENELYIKFFGKSKILKRNKIKEKLILFIPPILITAFSKLKKRLN